MAQVTILDALKQGTPEIAGKFLVAVTSHFGYKGDSEGVWEGHYIWNVVKDGDNYTLTEVNWSEPDQAFVPVEEPDIYTEDNVVYFVNNATFDPYNPKFLEKETLGDGENLEVQVLQAFLAFARGKFTLGDYNIFLDDTASYIADDLNDEGTSTTKAVTGITLDQSTLAVETGKTATLVATVAPEDATDKTVSFESSATDVATVDDKGVVTGVKAGTAMITAKAGDKTATSDVTVADPKA